MEIKIIEEDSKYWNATIDFAQNCSWSAGMNFANKMRDNKFTEFECPVIAIEDNKVVGFCALLKDDFIPNCHYTPWISFVFVDEHYRGQRISQKMINRILEYSKEYNINKVYICTGEDNLYEKYGFVHIDTLKSYADTMQKILMINIASE